MHQSRKTLRIEIEKLRQRQRSSDVVFAAFLSPDLWEEVLRKLRSGQPIESISEWLNGTKPSGTIIPP